MKGAETMKLISVVRCLLPVILLLSVASITLAAVPPANTIPIISMKTGQGQTSFDITLDVICRLLWQNFDGIWLEGWISGWQNTAVTMADSTGAYVVLAPSEIQEFSTVPSMRWARYSPSGLQSSSAFIHPSDDFLSIDSTANASSMIQLLESRCESLYSRSQEFDCIWYYDIFNEGPAWQLNRMNDSDYVYDDYFPNMYIRDSVLNLADSTWYFSLNQIDSTGIFSWASWKSDSIYNANSVYCPSVSVCFSSIHHIDSLEWGGCLPGVIGGSLHQQANSVRAYFSTKYLEYAPVGPYSINDNTPERMDLNCYPVRMAGFDWQTGNDTISVLGSATDLWMLEHYEEILDSTFNAASSGPFPIHYHAQGFGRTGGRAIWSVNEEEPPDTTIDYVAYCYRIPSPGEFRMLCNIGLLRGAKGVFPYSIRSYDGWKDDTLLHHDTGLLDEDLIPFDAPYEDWVYRERPPGDYYYAPPDSIPPWTAADGSQFDPLYSLPSRPTTTGAKAREDYLEWKFAAYGRLWNSARATFRQIAWIAPELSRLWWWYTGDRYDKASISYDSATIPLYFADPHIRVFTDSTESTCYLFYVNRFCRANGNPFEIEVDSGDFPGGTPFGEYALDHSRRFLIEGDMIARDEYQFPDTLDAGEARLLEMFDPETGLDADIRITDPDLYLILAADGDTLSDNTSYDSTAVDVVAFFYNMGTEPLEDVEVFLWNETSNELIARDTVSFNGLTIDTCYTPDVATAIFSWTPDFNDIGANVLRVYTEEITGEPDPDDNSATLVYLVKPIDYAASVLDDPWDMDPPAPPISPPAWKTFDIDSLTGCWGSYTDSISGMFEGTLSNPVNANALYLNTGSGRDDWIDADRFVNLSLAGYAEHSLSIEAHWMDSDSSGYFVDIQEDLGSTAADIGPVDLSSLSGNWTGDVIAFWLEFTGTNLATDVRIGWVKLTE